MHFFGKYIIPKTSTRTILCTYTNQKTEFVCKILLQQILFYLNCNQWSQQRFLINCVSAFLFPNFRNKIDNGFHSVRNFFSWILRLVLFEYFSSLNIISVKLKLVYEEVMCCPHSGYRSSKRVPSTSKQVFC